MMGTAVHGNKITDSVRYDGSHFVTKCLENICNWLACLLLNCLYSLRLPSTCVFPIISNPILTFLRDERLVIKMPFKKYL